MNCQEREHRIRMLGDSGRLRRHSIADFRPDLEPCSVPEEWSEEASTEHVETSRYEDIRTRNVQADQDENAQDENGNSDEEEDRPRLYRGPTIAQGRNKMCNQS